MAGLELSAVVELVALSITDCILAKIDATPVVGFGVEAAESVAAVVVTVFLTFWDDDTAFAKTFGLFRFVKLPNAEIELAVEI